MAAEHLRGEVDAPRFVSGRDMQIGVSVTALRRSPAHGALQDSQLLYGEVFRVYDRRGAWAWGQAQHDDYVGYLLDEDLVTVAASTHRLSALRSFVYTDADIKSRPLMAVSRGAMLTVVASEGAFYELSNGGFIIAAHVAPLGQWRDDYIRVAREYMGAPYFWGGRESLGLDCSALVQIALSQCGMACPRDSDMQEQVLGRKVETPQRGDLVFWKGHVGLMSEDDCLLHANAYTMSVIEEDFEQACARIGETAGPVRAIKRLD
jgi:cell wall-associated NlpC family hydrolase